MFKLIVEARLPNFFSFKSASDLVRIGRDYDGGYLVSQSDVDKSDLLIGLGISDDWSFEEDFTKIKDVEVYAYDASISQNGFLKSFIKSLLKINQPKFVLQKLNVLLSYRRFFSKSNRHHHVEKFVGLNSGNHNHCTLASILSDITSQNIFMKIDVEGSEYRFLDTIISNQSRISGLVLELHDCDLHLEKISNFIDKFDLKLVHIHANNYGQIRLDDGLPLVIEVTFSRYCKIQNEPSLPHHLDTPNSRYKDEIKVIVDGL
jgi:hypothetical protein